LLLLISLLFSDFDPDNENDYKLFEVLFEGLIIDLLSASINMLYKFDCSLEKGSLFGSLKAFLIEIIIYIRQNKQKTKINAKLQTIIRHPC